MHLSDLLVLLHHVEYSTRPQITDTSFAARISYGKACITRRREALVKSQIGLTQLEKHTSRGSRCIRKGSCLFLNEDEELKMDED